MTREEAIICLLAQAIKMAIKALEYDDAKYHEEHGEVIVDNAVWEDAKRALEQEPKTGHWEWVQYDSNPNIGNWHCSECRTIIPHMPEETDNTPIYKWCPMCGARMD